MAEKTVVIELQLQDQNAVQKLGALNVEARKVNDSIKLLNSIVDENGKATKRQEAQLGELIARKKNLSAQTRELSNDVSGLTASGMRFRDKMAAATLEAIKQSGVMGQLAARSDALTKEINELGAAFKAGTISEAQFTQQQNVLQAELGQTGAQLTRLDSKLDELNKDFQRGRITAEQFRAGVQSVNAEVRDASDAFTEGIGDLRSYALGFVGVIAAARAVGAVVGSAVGIMKDFDAAQSNLAAILQVNKSAMGALTEQAKQLGSTTAFTASQVTDGQTELAKLGFTIKQVSEATPGVLALAAATGTDLANAATIAAMTLNAFQLDASETGRIVDVIAKSASLSAFDIDTFSAAMSNAAPSANAVGVSVEKAAAMLSALVDAGIPAEKAGTDLRNVFIELSAKGLTWDQAMQQVRGSTDKLTTATDLFGKRSGSSGIILADSTDKLARLEEAYLGAAGAADEMAKTQLDNLKGDQLLLQSAWEGFVLSVDEGTGVIGKSLRAITQGFGFILEGLTKLENKALGGFTDQVKAAAAASGELKQANLDSADAQKIIAGYQEQVARLKDYGNTLGEVQLQEEERAKLQAQYEAMQGAVTERDKLRRIALGVAIKQYDEEIAKRRALLDIAPAEAEKAAEEAAAVKTVSAKREELTAKLENLKAEREDLSEADEDGIDTIDREIKAVNDAIRALDGKSTALGRNKKAAEEAAKMIRVITKDVRDFAAAQAALESGEGVGRLQLRVPAAAPLDEPENRLLPGTAIATDLTDNLDATSEVMGEYSQLFTQFSQSVGENLAGAFAGVEGANKKVLLSILETVRSAIRLYLAGTLAKELFTKGLAGIATFAAITVAVEAAFAAASAGITGFKEGGYTSKRSADSAPVGVVHANEYVIPASIVRDRKFAPLLKELEDARLKRGMGYSFGQFQTGGMVPAQAIATADNIAALRNINLQPVVRVTDINNVQQSVKVIQQRATL